MIDTPRLGPDSLIQSAEHASSGVPPFGRQLAAANFRYANCVNADLRRCDLTSADFTGADLRGADLRDANLTDANLRSATLLRASLSGASAAWANFDGANISDAHLRACNFSHSTFRGSILQRADLTGANLGGANLRRAVLDGARLSSAHLVAARLGAASMTTAILDGANLSGANLQGVRLDKDNVPNSELWTRTHLGQNSTNYLDSWSPASGGAEMRFASLCHANLSGCNLQDVDLSGANLEGAILGSTSLRRANLARTVLSDVALSDSFRGVEHASGAIIDWRTVARSLRWSGLHEFLLLTGVPEVVALYMLDSVRTIDAADLHSMLQSVFISYGRPDEQFATRLRGELSKNGVRTWFFPEDAEPGARLHRHLQKQIQRYDRMIVCCSKASLTRPGVLHELEEVLEREQREGGSEVLIPVMLESFLGDAGVPPTWWPPRKEHLYLSITSRCIADFRGTLDDEVSWKKQIRLVLKALKRRRSGDT